MPAILRPRCQFVFTLAAVMLLVCARADAQTRSGNVKLAASVSETVILSLPAGFTLASVNSDVVSSDGTVRLTLSSTNSASPVIRVPLLVRSNSGFKVSAFVEGNATITELSVSGVRATGNLVSPQAVNALDVNENAGPAPDPSQPLLVLTGPRVSLGGTRQSPNNALEVTVLIRLQPQSNRDWSLQLTFVGEPE